MTKKNVSVKYKKAPQAPRRFKSAYMFFSTEKHKEIRQELTEKNEKLPTTEVAKLVSQAWKDLPTQEREEWEEMARRDKARYEVEKSMYSGPWKIPAKKRSQKDPAAPKRPMSAFLSFSNSKRALIRKEHPDIGNAQVSRILAQMWKEAPEDERKQHIDKEFGLRQDYKVAIADWKKKHSTEQDAIRQQREQIAMSHVDDGKLSLQNGSRDLREKGQTEGSASDADKQEIDHTYGSSVDGDCYAVGPSGLISVGGGGGYSPTFTAVALGAGGATFGQPYQYSLGAPAYASLATAVGPTGAYDDLAAATSAYNTAAAGLYANVISSPSPFYNQAYGAGAATNLVSTYGGSLADAAYGGMPAFYGATVPGAYYSLPDEQSPWGYQISPGPPYTYGG